MMRTRVDSGTADGWQTCRIGEGCDGHVGRGIEVEQTERGGITRYAEGRLTGRGRTKHGTRYLLKEWPWIRQAEAFPVKEPEQLVLHKKRTADIATELVLVHKRIALIV